MVFCLARVIISLLQAHRILFLVKWTVEKLFFVTSVLCKRLIILVMSCTHDRMGRASASLRSSDPFPFSFFISRGERWVIKLQITETSPRACVKPESGLWARD